MSTTPPVDDGRISSMGSLLVLSGDEVVPVVTPAGENKKVKVGLLYGKTAYQLYTEAETAAGRTPLPQAQWLTSLTGPVGPDGKSAYQGYVAAETTAGRTPLAEADWLKSLQGPDAYSVYAATETAAGRTPLAQSAWLTSLRGMSAYEVYKADTTDNPAKTEAQWLASLQGSPGIDGSNGAIGKSAYQSYRDTTQDNPIKTEVDWTASLKGLDGKIGKDGADGKSAYALYVDTTTDIPIKTEAQWLVSLVGAPGRDGTNGTNGKSAYDLYVAGVPNGTTPLTQAAWLASLVGATGATGGNGANGKSAYEVYTSTTSDSPAKTPAQWLASLVGPVGPAGAMGTGLNFVAHIGATDPLPAASGYSNGDTVVRGTHFMKNDGQGNWVDLGDFSGATGKSAYELYVSNTSDVPVKTLVQWQASLVGPAGIGLIVHGELQSKNDLPTTGQVVGDAYIIQGYQKVWVGASSSLDGSGWATVGVPGPTGQSAYEAYAATETAAGRTPLALVDWVSSLVGKSAYQVYVAGVPNGTTPLSQSAWLASLVGPVGPTGLTGATGKSAYDLYVAGVPNGTTPLAQAAWLASLVGPQGAGIVVLATVADVTALNAAPQAPTGHGYMVGSNPANYYQWNGTTYVNLGPIVGATGATGATGKSAYEVYKANTSDVPVKTEAQWLTSLVGATGSTGSTGPTGKSAYELYVAGVPNGTTPLTQSAWLASLVGSTGVDGKSAYDLYVASVPNGTTPLTQSAWLTSLKGAQIVIKGHAASQAALPTTGVSVNDGYIADDTGHLWVANGSGGWTDTGQIKGDTGNNGKSAYELYVAGVPNGTTPLSQSAWLTSLVGPVGPTGATGGTGGTGATGPAGQSAYQLYVATTSDVPVKTQGQWMQSLNGQGIVPKGTVADTTALAAVSGMQIGWMYIMTSTSHMWIYGYNSGGSAAWLDYGSVQGPQGTAGLNAYQVYAAATSAQGQTPMDQNSWLLSLVGATGATGGTGRAIHMKGTLANITALNAVTDMAQGDGYFLQSPAGELYVYDTTNGWVDQGNFLGPQGVQGPMGPGVQIMGTYTNSSQLPATGTLGQGYLIGGDFWGWTGSAYQDLGKIQGPTGPQGLAGPVGPAGPTGATGSTGQRGSQIIILARDPQVTDGIVQDVFINVTLQTVYQKTTTTNWAYMGTFGGGNVMDAASDGVKRVRQNAGWVTLPVDEATPDANFADTPQMRNPNTHAWVPFNRYDMPIKDITTDGVMDFSKYQAFKVDGSKLMTLTTTNKPANRFMTCVLIVNGAGTQLTWPSGIVWSDGVAPPLGASRSDIVMTWDGTNLMGMVGPAV